jgi:hypothetical protein
MRDTESFRHVQQSEFSWRGRRIRELRSPTMSSPVRRLSRSCKGSPCCTIERQQAEEELRVNKALLAPPSSAAWARTAASSSTCWARCKSSVVKVLQIA